MRSFQPVLAASLILCTCVHTASSDGDAAPPAPPPMETREPPLPAAAAPVPVPVASPAPSPEPPASPPQEDEPKPRPEPPHPAPVEQPAEVPPPAAAPVPAPQSADDAAESASDATAREILASAAALQSAGDLARPGALASFHVVFHKAVFERERTDPDGRTTTQLVETDEGGLVFKWLTGSILTAVTIDGATTTKAWYEPRKIGWISDGSKVSSLLGAEHKADYDQLQFHRTVIDRLLDVAILGKMLDDGSRWRTLTAAARYEKTVALQRVPPADRKDAAPITLWIENPSEGKYGDVVAAAIPPSEEGGPALVYRFTYDERFPAVRVKAEAAEPAQSKLRFPFGVTVHEERPGDESPRKVLEVFTREVSINTVVEADFHRPKPR